MPPLQNRNFKHEAFLVGKDFIFKNDADTLLFRARMAASLLTILLAVLFLAAQEMFGTGAAFLGLALLVFDPTLLAHGAVVGTDVGLSCFMFASIYAFYRYAKVPSAWRLLVVALATGLALASKHTAILVFPMLFLLAVCEVVRRGSKAEPGLGALPRTKRALRLAIALAVISVIAITALWASYGFRHQVRADGWQLNPPLAEFVHNLSRPPAKFVYSRRSFTGDCCPSHTFMDWPTSASCPTSTPAMCSAKFIRMAYGSISRQPSW
jgi:hypothetical protein